MLSIMAFACNQSFGQSFLDRLKKKAKETVEEKIINKTGNGIDNGIDKGIEKAGGAIKGSKSSKDESNNESSGNSTANMPKGNEKMQMNSSYAKYDFVPGEQVIYAADFKEERSGELPQDWNSNGNAIVSTLSGSEVNWLRIMQRTLVLSSNTKTFGTDFTMEFDLLMQYKRNGWVVPNLNFGFLATGKYATTDNNLLKTLSAGTHLFQVILHPADEGRSNVKLESFVGLSTYFESGQKKFPDIENMYGKKVHVAVQIQKERFRLWMDGIKVYDVPKALPVDAKLNQVFFQMEDSSYDNEDIGVYVSELKIAKGIPNLRHKLIDEGKFSTTGILFDVNKASIKPESAGVINEIAEVLKQNPNVKIMITGHTDSDGDEKANQSLSEKRAERVKAALITVHGIPSDRLQSSGKGESVPVGSNSTKDGKAQNRRVEFTKL